MSKPSSVQTDLSKGDELEQLAKDLGPFDLPANYRFEPEFDSVPPRTIHPELRHGRYCHKKRLCIIGLFVVSIVLLACSFTPILKTWGLYLLPLQYLDWIGAGLLFLTGLTWVHYTFTRGPFVYVEEGIPLVARIITQSLHAKQIANGIPTIFQYVVMFQHRDPETGNIVFASDTYEINADAKNELMLSYRVGDYVTAVYLRSKPAKSLRLYGFLDLRPDLGIIDKKEHQQWPIWELIAGILLIAVFFFILCWNIYAFGKFQPLEMSLQNHSLPFAIGVVLLGGLLLSCIAWNAAKAKRMLEKNNQEAVAEGGTVEISWQPKRGLFGQGPIMSVIILLGSVLLGGMTMLCWAFTLNSLCDSSPATPRPVIIREMWMETHNLIAREYTIEYQFFDDPANEKRKLMTTPQHLASFGLAPTGIAQVRQGFFGWPWVETITPIDPNEDEKEK